MLAKKRPRLAPRQPKLLPCQHTFCYPCLESCADSLHRTLKCPECRAEHSIPYEGVKAFQSNYTLTGFLEIHLQATPDSAAEIEEYIRRYNLERCKVCDEKADCELCAHCERKACKECRQTHMDMLKRDLGRLLNQVRRLSNRIIEASDGLSKGLELLSLNCETTKDEVKEYFHRHLRDLKKREDAFLSEIDTFHATESRLMSNLRDVLEIESSNMSEAVARLDAVIKPDADELFNRKLRFSAGEDAARLPQAITTCGELCVLVPQFAGRYLPLEQSYLPRPFRLTLESDQHRTRHGHEDSRANDRDRPSSRLTVRDLDEGSIRYRRRQQLEEEAWNRLRGSSAAMDRSDRNGTSSATPADREGSLVARSPWSRPPEASSLNATPAPPVRQVERKQPAKPIPLNVPRPERAVQPRTDESPAPRSPKPPPSPAPVIRAAEPAKEEAEEARIAARRPPLPRQASSNDESLNEKVDVIRRAHAERQAASRAASSDESEAEEASRPKQRIRIVCRAASTTREEEPIATAASVPPGVPIPVTHFTDSSTSTEEERRNIRRRSASREISEWRSRGCPRVIFGRKGAKEGELNWPRGVCALRGKFLRQFGGYGSGRGQLDSAAGIATFKNKLIVSDRYNHRVCIFDNDGTYLNSFGGHGQSNGKFNNPWGVAVDELGTIYVADKDNHRVQMFDKNGLFVGKFGTNGHGPGQLHNPLFIAVNNANHQVYVSDSSNHRICVFDVQGMFLFSFGTEGFHGGQFKFPRGVAVDSQVFSSDGEFICTFGSWGGGAGQLKGVEALCVFDGGIVASDRENHRIQIF
ncbi:zinc finger, C3HC4 type [Teladorsagia circumcincta]|uniref:Zinc finger, C3HC4 type n=1 Tax=Teladorsagia circumcincta TaxID=45464 RepID=A0A2G9UHG2_TELCI|nr:zinc finger, C3HC4 type [Teladorsagia circumcincta]